MKCGIYSIRSKNTNFVYIGGSRDIDVRWEGHLATLRTANHHCLKLMSLYAIDPDLQFSVLELCEVEQLKEKENFWISKVEPHLLLNTIASSGFSSCDDPEKLENRLLNGIKKKKDKENAKLVRREKLLETYSDIFTGELETASLNDGFKYRQLISVLDNNNMNKSYGNSSYFTSWFIKNIEDTQHQIKNNLCNFFNRCTKTTSDKNLWTTYESSDHTTLILDKGGKPIGESKRETYDVRIRDLLIDKPYRQVGGNKFKYDLSHISDQATDDEIEAERKRACWVPVVSNSDLYVDRTSLAFVMNIYLPTELRTLCKDEYNIDLSSDDFALRLMLRWIFQSAVRNDQPIIIYVPSVRMRHLLLTWLGYTQEELF